MTLKWSIDQAHGRLSFGRLYPMTGNTYEIAVSGQTEGTSYQFYVMDESGEKCLARSSCTEGVYTIAFDTTELRRNFQKEWHECRPFHTVVSDGENTIAEGDLPIVWNPVWTDPGTSEAYTMKGDPGNPGEPGRRGERGKSAYEVWIDEGHSGTVADFLASIRGSTGTERVGYCEIEGCYHRVYLAKNERNEYVWTVDETKLSSDDVASVVDYVLIDGEQTITGKKTFTGETRVPTFGSTDDNSTRAASTAWVTSKLSAWWTALDITTKLSAWWETVDISAKANVWWTNLDITARITGIISTWWASADITAKANAWWNNVSFVGKTRIHHIGEMFMMATATTPSGAFPCDGRAISRTQYAALFSVIGTNYGAGDGSTTFNIPNHNTNEQFIMSGSAQSYTTFQTAAAHTHDVRYAVTTSPQQSGSAGAKSVSVFKVPFYIQYA